MAMKQGEYQIVEMKLPAKMGEVRSDKDEPVKKNQNYEVADDGKELPSKMQIINELGEMITIHEE